MDVPSLDGDLRQLGQLLWRYREQLEQLEFLLDVQGLLVAGGRQRWLARVVDQLETATGELDRLEGQRQDLAGRVGRSLGLGDRPSLGQLSAAAPEPWDAMLGDHLAWFTAQTARIAELVRQLRASVGDGLTGVHQLLQALRHTSGSGYDHGGRLVTHAAAGSLLFDDRA